MNVSEIRSAALHGNFHILKDFIKGDDVKMKLDENGNSVSHYLVEGNQFKFIENNISLIPDIANNFGLQHIHIAAQKGFLHCVKSLTNFLDSRDPHGFLPLHFAVSFGHAECVEYILKNTKKCEILDINIAINILEYSKNTNPNLLQMLNDRKKILVTKITRNNQRIVKTKKIDPEQKTDLKDTGNVAEPGISPQEPKEINPNKCDSDKGAISLTSQSKDIKTNEDQSTKNEYDGEKGMKLDQPKETGDIKEVGGTEIHEKETDKDSKSTNKEETDKTKSTNKEETDKDNKSTNKEDTEIKSQNNKENLDSLPLHKAAKEGNVKEINSILKSDPSKVNTSKDSRGNTFLHFMAKNQIALNGIDFECVLFNEEGIFNDKKETPFELYVKYNSEGSSFSKDLLSSIHRFMHNVDNSKFLDYILYQPHYILRYQTRVLTRLLKISIDHPELIDRVADIIDQLMIYQLIPTTLTYHNGKIIELSMIPRMLKKIPKKIADIIKDRGCKELKKDFSYSDKMGKSFLHYIAITEFRKEKVLHYVEKGATIRFDREGKTPLDSLDLTTSQLRKCNLDERYFYNEELFLLLIRNKEFEESVLKVNTLIARGCFEKGFFKVIKYLAEIVDFKSLTKVYVKRLIEADRADILELIARRGFNFCEKYKNEYPLQIAAKNNKASCAYVMLNNNSYPKVARGIDCDFKNVIKVLIYLRKSEPNDFLAIIRSKTDMLMPIKSRVLIEAFNCNCNFDQIKEICSLFPFDFKQGSSYSNATFIVYAATYCTDVEVIKYLIEKGADPKDVLQREKLMKKLNGSVKEYFEELQKTDTKI